MQTNQALYMVTQVAAQGIISDLERSETDKILERWGFQLICIHHSSYILELSRAWVFQFHSVPQSLSFISPRLKGILLPQMLLKYLD